jgi:hypothetical protein
MEPKINFGDLTPYLPYALRRYDMNGRSQIQEDKNWILPKETNANRFF